MPAPELVEIDLDGITNRIVAFPVPEGRYGRVLGTRDGALFTSLPVEGLRTGGSFDFKPKSNGSLEWYDFEKHKQEHIADEVGDISVTADGKVVLYYSHDRLRVLKAGEKPPELPSRAADKPGRESGWLDLDRVKVSIQPGAEWRQMYREAWRLQREQYWAADMSGIDWQAVSRPLRAAGGPRRLARGTLRPDVGDAGRAWLVACLRVRRRVSRAPALSRRAAWAATGASTRTRASIVIARIARGDPWAPEATSPLLAPGVNVAVGDAVIAINGQRVTRSADRSIAGQPGGDRGPSARSSPPMADAQRDRPRPGQRLPGALS